MNNTCNTKAYKFLLVNVDRLPPNASWVILKHSIANRLAVRATKEIENISIARSINGLKNKVKKTCLLVDYNTQCNIRKKGGMVISFLVSISLLLIINSYPINLNNH